MPMETFAFDASEHLDDMASQIEYLCDAVSTGKADAIVHAIGVVARARGMSQIALDAGIDREALYLALDPMSGTEVAAVTRIASALTESLRVAA